MIRREFLMMFPAAAAISIVSRVAWAAGEGAAVVAQIHRYLAEQQQADGATG